MKLKLQSWTRFLELLFPRWAARGSRKRRARKQHLRRLTLQGLEARQYLTASLQVYNGGTQLTNGSYDSFGTVNVGASDTQSLMLKNVGSTTLSINSDSLPYGFSSSTYPPLSIQPGQYTMFNVSMNTNSMGNYSGQLQLSTNDPNNSTYTLNLSGSVQQSGGSGGTISVSDNGTNLSNGANDSFGSVSVGSSDSKSFQITNSGSGTLTVSSVSLPSGYSLNTSLPLNIGMYQSQSLSVNMSTSSPGTFSGQMLLQSSDTSHNPFTLNLSGTVTGSSSPSIELEDNSTVISNGGSDSFGSVTQNSSDTRTYTVINQGSGTLTVSSVSLPTGYSLQTSLPLNVSAGNSGTFVVGLSTSSVGTYSGTMTVSSNSSQNNPFNVSLSGTVTAPPAPVMVLADGSTNVANGGSDTFASATQGSSDTKTFTVKNTGNASLSVSAISLPGSYSLQTSLPLTIAAGSSTTFVIGLSTSAIGTFTGTMGITDTDSGNNPYNVSLSGTVTAPPAPTMSLADGSTNIANGGSDSFTSATQGSSDTKTFTVNNTGTASLTVSAISLPSGYSLQTSLPLTVAANGSATFAVSLDTSAIGTFTGTMSITDTDSQNDPYNVSLSGTVTAPPTPIMSLADGSTSITNGGSDSFGSATQGDSDSRTYTVSNTGNASLSVSAISLPDGYSLQTSLPLTIDANSSATFVVSLSTAAIGNYQGTMTVTDTDANNNPWRVNLSGSVTVAPAPLMRLADGTTGINNGGSDGFGTWSVGDSVSRTFQVSNAGTANLTVSAVSLPTGFSLGTSLPLTIAANSSANFTVSMDTNSATSYSGTMSISDNDSENDPYDVTLSGTVTFPNVTIQATTPTANEQTHAPGQFTVSRTGTTVDALTVNYTASGTAVSGVDYTALAGSVTIPANMTSATIQVTPLTGGHIDQVQEIVVPAATGGSYTLSIGSDTTAALTYDASAADVASALAALASVGTGRVTVSGSGTAADPFLTTFDGPLGGEGLPQILGDGSLLSGGDSTTIDTSIVTAADDGGTVQAALASSSSYAIGSPAQDTVNVIGDEPPVVTVVATQATADEVSGAEGVFTLYRNGPTSDPLTVEYSLGGSALDGVDFRWLSGSVTFAAGAALAEVDIQPLNNGLSGADKTAVLTLVAPTPGGQNPPAYALAGASSDTVTIVNGNLPLVSLVASTPTANAATGTAGEFMVVRNGLTDNPLTIAYTVGGSAVAATNYQPLTGSVTIPAGANSAAIDVSPIDNGAPGTNTSSTVVVTLATAAAYQVGTYNSDTVTIDDDKLPQVSIAASTPFAVEQTAAPGAFMISIASAQPNDLTIPYTESGTAISGTDFQVLSGSAIIPAGQTSVVVPVVPLSDPNEFGFTTVQVTLTSGSSYELTASQSAVVSIEGNLSLPTVTLQATTPVADEIAGTNGEFTVTRTGSTADALTAYYTIAGTALDGTDYNLLPGSVTIPAGQVSTTILITPLDDTAMEDSSRTVTLTLTNYGGPDGASYSIGNPATDTVTIDDLPTVTVQATTATAEEHELTPGVFTVTRANDPLQATQALTVNYTIAGTAVGGTSYQTLSGRVTIAAGQPSATIDVTPIDAGLVGGSQAVTLTLSSGGYLVGSAGSDTVTIEDDDPPTVTIQATTPKASEASGSAGVFTVKRNGPTTDPLTVSYNVSGTAISGTGFQPVSGSVTIPAGQSGATIDITPIDIGQIGGSATVIVGLESGAGYAVGTPASDTVTILENDLPTVTLVATQTHATESGTTGTFTVTRNGATTAPLIVLYSVAGTATESADYQALPGYVTIPAGQASATITVTPINDPLVEQDQTVVLALASTSQYLAGSQYSDTVTIFDDNLPSVTVAATADADEHAGTPGTFTVTRVGPTDNPLTVSYTVSGTAQSGTDYTAFPSTATIPAGQSSATIDVAPLPDATPETQQIVIPRATDGTYTLTVTAGTVANSATGTDGTPASSTTAPLAYNADAAAVQAALEVLPEVGTGNAIVSGDGTAASPFVVQFVGGLVGVEMPQITADGSQLSGTTSVTVVTTTAGDRGVDQVEQVGYTATGNVTGGPFTLSYNGQTTTPLAYNASASDVQTALGALSMIGAGNVAVTATAAGPQAFGWQLTFQGARAKQELGQVTTNVSQITVASGSATAADSTITFGSSIGGINAVQQITVSGAVGGTFTLSYQGHTMAAIAYNASAAGVATALQTITALSGNVAVSGAAGGPWSLTFQGNLADQSVPDLTADGSGLTLPATATTITTVADGQRTVSVALATSSNYTIGTLDTPTASGGTGASDTLTITDPGNNVAPTIVVTSYTTQLDQPLSVPAPGVLVGWQDPNAEATVSAILLTGPSDGTLTLNADGSFTYTPNAGFEGTDQFAFQAYDDTTYSTPAVVTISVVPVPAPQLGVSDGGTDIANGGNLDVGLAWVNTPLTQSITIANNGTADLTLDPASLVLPAGFSLLTPFASDVAAGSSTTMTVQMDAATAGTYSGAASFNWGDSQSSDEFTFSFTLSGTVSNPAPVLAVLNSSGSPLTESFDFGTTGQGEPLTELLIVQNTGTADLVLSDPIGLPDGFTLVQDFGATTLAPGATTTFAIEMTAAATGSDSGNLTFAWGDDQNASDYSYTLPLSGTVVASPVVEVLDGTTTIANSSSGTPVDFGTALVGTAVTQVFTIDNNGTSTLTLDPTQLVLPAGYSVLTPYATSVAAGGSTTLTIEVDGSAAGVFSGSISFPTNDVDNPTFTFPVTGEIDTPEPKLELFDGATHIIAGTTFDFGTTPVGTPEDVTLTVENAGTADLNLPAAIELPSGFTLVSISPAGSGDPVQTIVAAGGSATITLELMGDFSGSYTGTASIYTNDPAAPFSFNLTGVVASPQVQVTSDGNVIEGGVGAGAAGNPPATVDFGDADLNSPLVETFTVTNVGTGALSLLDPIVVPYGFSVTSDFGATTLAPGDSTTFSVELDASATGAYQGTLAFESNDPDQPLFYFSLSGQVATPVMQVSDGMTNLVSGSSDDFGNTPQGTDMERTFNIVNTGTGTLTLSDPISLPSGFTLVSDFGSASLAPGDSTSFTVELNATSAGFYSGNIAFGNDATIGGTFEVAVSGGVAVPRFEVLEGTTDVTNAATPVDLGETVIGIARTQTFTVENAGSDALVLSDPIGLPAGFTLSEDISATSLAPGDSATFTVELPATTAGDYSGSISFGTNLANIPTYTLPIQGEVIGLDNFRLWNDTGYSSTDGHTSDPTVAGNLVGVPAGTNVEVQFTTDSGATINGSVSADSSLPFTYPPVGLTNGPVTVDARIRLVDAVLGDLYTDWTPLSFTLESGTDAAPVVTNLALQTITVPSASTPTSSDSTIIGSVLHDGNVAYMTVQIDTTGSGHAVDSVTTDANGNFVYSPQNLAPGTYTYHFQAIENAYPSGEITGPWEPFTFTVVAPNPPVVDQLSLANVTGAMVNGSFNASATTNPTLAGHVTADGNPQQAKVDFDYNGDGVADASTTASADGSFTFTPVGLPLGSVTIHVRAVNVDDNITGNWTTISFTLAAPQAPAINTLSLLNVTGGANSGVTDDPTVTGTLAASALSGAGASLANVTVQFDTNGDGLPDGSTTSDANGNFTWTPRGVNPGTVTIAARAVTTDSSTGKTLVGAWKSLSFTYSTSAGPVVNSLSLAHPTGTDSTTGLSTAIDPTLAGTLTNGTELASFLTVQYIVGSAIPGGGSGGAVTPDGSTTSDAQGHFTLGLKGLSPGSQTVQVRGVTRDPQTGAEVDGAWKTIKFELQQNPIEQPPVTPADSNAVATGDQVAATSKQADVQAVDDGIQSFNAAMGASSTPAGQIFVGVGTYTALAGMLGGSVVSGSIFGVENGSLPAPAGVGGGSGDPGTTVSGPSLPGSTPAGLPSGTALSVSSLAALQAGSGTISNQTVAANGALGPGYANLTGLVNGSWTITVAPDPNDSSITDWTVTVSLTETFQNDLVGSYADTDGAATLNHDYSDNVGGSYSFTFQASGTTTQTSVGSIVAGIYTLVENNPYNYSFSDTSVGNALSGVPGAGASSTSNETLTSSGSHSFEHIDTSGSFSVGGGLPSNGDEDRGGTAGPTLSSNFINNEGESYQSADASSGSYNNGSPDGSDQGGSSSNETFSYTRNQFAAGVSASAGATWSDDASFKDDVNESDSSSQSSTDRFSESTADGQISGGLTESITTSDSFDDTESGNWNISPNSYSLTGGKFDDKQSDSESDQIAESGSESENMNGITSTDSFSFNEKDNAKQTDEEDGSDGAQGTNFTANGSFDDSENISDQIDYSDSGSYSGTIQGPAFGTQGSGTGSGTGSSSGGSTAPGPETVSGSYSDSSDETDSANESDSGTFGDNNGQISDNGQEQDSAQTDDNYQSSGSDSESDPNGSYSDSHSDKGEDKGTINNSDTFSDSPTNDTADGTETLNVNDTNDGTASESGTSTSPTSTITFSDSLTDDTTDGEQVTDNYTDTSDPATGSFNDENKGSASENDSEDQTVNWDEQGNFTGANPWQFSEGGTGQGDATDGVSETFDDTNSNSAGEADTDNGTFTDGDNSHTTAFYNDSGTTNSPGMTVNYTDGDNQQETAGVTDSGTFSDGTNHDVTDNFDNTDEIQDDAKSTANGTYNQAGTSGTFSVTATDDKTDDSSDDGNKDDNTTGGAKTVSGTDNFTVDDTDHSTFNEKDSGQFTGAATGTYSDTHSTDDTTTDDETGTTTTAANAATTDGTYNDGVHDITSDTSQATETQGPITTTGSHTDFADVKDDGNGTFDDTSSGDTVDGSFDDKETDLTTDSGSQTISVPGDTSTQSGSDATLSKSSSDGSETGAVGSPTDSGNGTGDVLEIDTGSASRQITSPNSSQSQSSSGKSVDRGHAGGDFTNNGGAIVSEDMKYSDDDKSKYQSQFSSSSSGPNSLGGTSSWSETSNNNDKSTIDDSGERDVAAGVTTDDGTAKDTDHGTSSYTTQTTITSPTGSVGWTMANGDTSDDLTTDKYDITGAGRTDDASFDNEDRPTAEYHYQGNYATPGDPGTNWSSTEDDTTKGDNTDDGTVDKTNGNVTDETDNFNDVTKSTSDTSYNAAGGVGGVAVTAVPTLIMQYIGPWDAPTGPFVAAWSGAGLSGDAVRTGSATASSTNDDKATDVASGTTTDTNGTINTDETFSHNETDTYSDNTSQSGAATYSNGQQLWTSTASDSGTATDSSSGTIKAGETTATYNNSGEETDTADNSSSWYATDPSSDGGGVFTNDSQATGTSSETGGYTTAAPGTVVARTADNPNGYAITTQTITEHEVITENRNQQLWADDNANGLSVSGAGSYTGVGKATLDTTSTVSVNAAQGTDVQSGSFSGSDLVTQKANYGETGSLSSSSMAIR